MKVFSRREEDFVCENCGAKVIGNGYTNHCPKCLYSKHVDVNPGDRSADCGGLMEPVDIEIKDGNYVLIHKCKKCGFVRKNKVGDQDDFDAVINISRNKTARLKG